MKKVLFISVLIFSMGFICLEQASAKTRGKSAKGQKAAIKSKAQPSRLGARLGTEFQFDDMSVNGHYQSAFEGVATVENEKVIEDLLDYRIHYRDRLAKSKTQY